MIQKIILVFILLFKLNSYSQNFIEGTTKDNKKEQIISASIILKDNTGNIIAYTYTDENGKYELNVEKTGTFILIANSMGFEQKSIDIRIENKNEKNTIDFVLTPKVTELKEVIINHDRPITIKKDTIIFNADSFKQGNEQVVEDLLKKIPGLNIDANGTIKVGNHEVEKVMIDGDDMFEKGYKILTK